MNTIESYLVNLGLEQHLSYWTSGGLLLLPIAITNLGIWIYFIRSRQLLKSIIQEGRQIHPAISQLDTNAKPETILELLSRHKGGFAVIIRTVMQDVLRGGHLLDSFDNRENEGVKVLSKDFIIVSACTTIAPLLGLLGTVMGMIETFDAVSVISGDTGTRVASGISQALITTQFGLVVALPGLFGIAYLRRLLSQVKVNLAECRTHIVALLERKDRMLST